MTDSSLFPSSPAFHDALVNAGLDAVSINDQHVGLGIAHLPSLSLLVEVVALCEYVKARGHIPLGVPVRRRSDVKAYLYEVNAAATGRSRALLDEDVGRVVVSDSLFDDAGEGLHETVARTCEGVTSLATPCAWGLVRLLAGHAHPESLGARVAHMLEGAWDVEPAEHFVAVYRSTPN